MNAAQWQLTKALFEQALTYPSEEREQFVLQQGELDDEVQRKLLAMLLEHENSETLADIVEGNVIELLSTEPILQPDEQIEQFVVRSQIGEGGMGQVFLAERNDGQFEQRVAIKVIQGFKLSAENELRFKQERQVLARLNHRNIAGLIGGGQMPSGNSYIIMEYVEGIAITEYCLLHKLGVVAILRLFQQVLSAVTYVHQNLVVHRDIKPSNVLVTTSGEVKLLDFGIARLLRKNEEKPMATELTQTSASVLTHACAAPEQVLGESITTLTDVYALGALLSHMLCGESVFALEAKSRREVETFILDKTPLKPSDKTKRSNDQVVKARSPQISTDLDTIVQHALHKLPENRYPSAELFYQDINNLLAHYPIMARKLSKWYSIRKFVARNTLSSALGAAFVLGLIGFSAVLSHQSKLIEQERDKAVQQATIARQTTQYLTAMFEAANPNQNDGEVFTARALLDQALASTENLEVEDAIKIELINALQGVYTQIGEYDTAQSLSERVQTLIEFADIPPADKFRLTILIAENTGNLLINLGEYDAAITLFKQQIADLEVNSAALEQAFILYYQMHAHYGLATALTYVHQDQDSVKHYQNTITLAKGSAYEHQMLASAYLGLGHTLRLLGQFEASKEQLLLGIAAERKHNNNRNSLELAHGLNQLASTLLKLSQPDAALTHALEGLAIRQAIHKPDNVEIIASMGMVANIYAVQQQYAKALNYRKQSLELLESAVGKSHPFYVTVETVIGRLHYLNSERELAKPILQAGLRRFEQIDLIKNNAHIGAMLVLGEINLEENNLMAAKALFDQALAITTSYLPEGHYLIAQSHIYLAVTEQRLTPDIDQSDKINKSLGVYRQTFPETTNQYQTLTTKLATWQNN